MMDDVCECMVESGRFTQVVDGHIHTFVISNLSQTECAPAGKGVVNKHHGNPSDCGGTPQCVLSKQILTELAKEKLI